MLGVLIFMSNILLSCQNIYKTYGKTSWFSHKAPLDVLKGISFNLEEGRSLGIVGINGAGKSTLTKIILGLEFPNKGKILFEGINIHQEVKKHNQNFRQNMQAVFQNPSTALNPRFSAFQVLCEPLQNFFHYSKQELLEKTQHLMEIVELNPKDIYKNSMQFSGGQQQRLAIARAIALNPKLLILDEALSSLDMSTQSQIIKLLHHLKTAHKISLFLISHEIRLTFNLCDDIIVLDNGKICDVLKKENGLPKKRSPILENLLAHA